MAIQVTGTTDRHLYTTSTNFVASTAPYSIAVWINAVWTGGARLSFVGMYDGALVTPTPTTGLQIGTANGAGDVTCWTYGGTTLVAGTGMTAFNNTWVLITYTYDGTNHRVYRNNTLLNTATTAVVPGTFTQIYINGFPPTGSSDETATYQVDSYSYYNRQLSIDEITCMYNAQGARHGISYGVLAQYDFDELAAGSVVTSVVDVSGNGNTMLNAGAGTAITYTFNNTTAVSNLRTVQ